MILSKVDDHGPPDFTAKVSPGIETRPKVEEPSIHISVLREGRTCAVSRAKMDAGPSNTHGKENLREITGDG